MIEIFYRLVLTFNSTVFIIIIFCIKEKIVINNVISQLSNLPSYVSFSIYILIPIITSYMSILLTKCLPSDNFMDEEKKSIVKYIEPANNAYMPSYLGYFFVALSVPNVEVMFYVYLILFTFTYSSQTLYFNPLFLLFGYNFYYMTTIQNKKILMISKTEYNLPSDVIIEIAKRINSFTFIHKQEKSK